eukprot:scaffold818_cov388-Pavlova_lutheri.AAC.6
MKCDESAAGGAGFLQRSCKVPTIQSPKDATSVRIHGHAQCVCCRIACVRELEVPVRPFFRLDACPTHHAAAAGIAWVFPAEGVALQPTGLLLARLWVPRDRISAPLMFDQHQCHRRLTYPVGGWVSSVACRVAGCRLALMQPSLSCGSVSCSCDGFHPACLGSMLSLRCKCSVPGKDRCPPMARGHPGRPMRLSVRIRSSLSTAPRRV